MSAPVVLVAEDDESDLHFLRRALTQALPGIRVEDVSDGQQAVDYLLGRGKYGDRSRHPFPTHVVLDVKMPRLTGLEVLEWLRAHREIGRPAVTVLSGSQLEGDRIRANGLGAEYVIKPVAYAELLAIARRICERAAADAASQ